MRSVRQDIIDFQQFFHDPTFSVSVAFIAIAAFFGLFWLLIHRIFNLAGHIWLAWLGALTYPLYLIHSTIGFILFQRLSGYLDKYVLLGGLLAIMLLTAYIIHHWIEKPLTKPLGQVIDKLLNLLA